MGGSEDDMDDLAEVVNRELRKDFPDTRLTHEPVIPTMRHAEINGGTKPETAHDQTLADQLERKLKAALEHLAIIRLLSREIGQ
jgi:hypothetical protein